MSYGIQSYSATTTVTNSRFDSAGVGGNISLLGPGALTQGFYAIPGIPKPNVPAGGTGGIVALQNLIAALVNMGLITNL